MKKLLLVLLIISGFYFNLSAQTTKILFDATKAETAGNADWIIDADLFNIGYDTGIPKTGTGNEANAQRLPTPAQSGITANTSESYWKGAISNWGIDCVKRGYTVETLPYNGLITYGNTSNPQDLKNYSAFIVCEPNIRFTTAEKTALIQYVQNGGGLMMVSDHDKSDRNNDGWDSPAIWNDLMTSNSIKVNPFGISFDLKDYSETSSNIANLPADSILHGPFGTVTKVQWSGGTTMTISAAANSSVKGIIYKTGSSTTGSTNVFFAHSNYGLGKVAAIGDSSPCDDGSGDNNDVLYNGYITDASGNHQKLLMNAVIWLVSHANVLPLNFVQISGITTGQQNTINWTVAENTSDKNFYEIQHAADAIHFSSVATLNAHSNINGLSNYTFSETQPASPATYYRVKATDQNNQIVYSSIVTINNRIGIKKLQLMPSPFTNILSVYFPAAQDKTELKIYNSAGILVYYKMLLQQQKLQQVNASTFSKGTYWVTLNLAGKVIESKIAVKQ